MSEFYEALAGDPKEPILIWQARSGRWIARHKSNLPPAVVREISELIERLNASAKS